jgi:Rps23 Pro-64 3,4-dihydroxylase Tpa1-like proline 4-hydroxylase
MNTATLFACFGDVIELDFPLWDINQIQQILDFHSGWKQYNPRKGINRYGLSVTSLDGEYSGVPDLDSLLEYNKLNNTNYSETSFNVKTDIVEKIPNLNELLSALSPNVGRCHFLKINAGGFFPPHRDNGSAVPSPSFRIIVPLGNTKKKDWHWMQEGQLLNLTPGKTYCINTTKEHSIFSFRDNCCMLVLNVIASLKNIQFITTHLETK